MPLPIRFVFLVYISNAHLHSLVPGPPGTFRLRSCFPKYLVTVRNDLGPFPARTSQNWPRGDPFSTLSFSPFSPFQPHLQLPGSFLPYYLPTLHRHLQLRLSALYDYPPKAPPNSLGYSCTITLPQVRFCCLSFERSPSLTRSRAPKHRLTSELLPAAPRDGKEQFETIPRPQFPKLVPG